MRVTKLPRGVVVTVIGVVAIGVSSQVRLTSTFPSKFAPVTETFAPGRPLDGDKVSVGAAIVNVVTTVLVELVDTSI